MTDVLAKADLPTGEKFHSKAASYYLGGGGAGWLSSRVCVGELDSSFMEKAVYVVTKRDGKALSQKDGPLQLVVPGEKRGARWVRQVTALKIREAN